MTTGSREALEKARDAIEGFLNSCTDDSDNYAGGVAHLRLISAWEACVAALAEPPPLQSYESLKQERDVLHNLLALEEAKVRELERELDQSVRPCSGIFND